MMEIKEGEKGWP